MLKKKFQLLVIFLVVLAAQGQPLLDSLMIQLNTSKDSFRTELYIQLAQSLSSENPEKSLSYAELAEQLAIETGDAILLAKSLNSKGVAYYYLNELEKSNQYYFEALTIFDSLDYKPGFSRSINNIGWNFKVQDKMDDAIYYFK